MSIFRKIFSFTTVLTISTFVLSLSTQNVDFNMQKQDVRNNKTIKQVVSSSSSQTTFAILNDGFSDYLYSWGRNEYGMLGLGFSESEVESVNKPTKVDFNFEESITIKKTAANNDNAGAIINDGESDSFYLWGSNTYGQIGNGNIGGEYSSPTKVNLPNDLVLKDFSMGSWYTALLANDGSKDYLYLWGHNPDGEIGNGTKEDVSIPTSINVDGGAEGIEGEITHLDTNYHTSGVVIDDGTNENLYMWGSSSEFQISSTSTTPKVTPTIVDPDGGAAGFSGTVTHFSLGREFAGIVINDGIKDNLYMWGKNSSGEIGVGSATSTITAKSIVNLDDDGELIEGEITHLSLGDYNSGMVVKNDTGQHLYMWGTNTSAQIGNGTIGGEYLSPTEVIVDGSTNGIKGDVKSFSIGYYHSAIVITENNQDKLYMWGGNNSFGEIGNEQFGGNVIYPTDIEILNFLLIAPKINNLEVKDISDKSVKIEWDILDPDNTINSIKLVDSSRVLYDMETDLSGIASVNNLDQDTNYTDWRLQIDWGNSDYGFNTIVVDIESFTTTLFNIELLLLIIFAVIIILFLLILLIVLLTRRNKNKTPDYNVFQYPPNGGPYFPPNDGNYIGTNNGQDHYLESNYNQEPTQDYIESNTSIDEYNS